MKFLSQEKRPVPQLQKSLKKVFDFFRPENLKKHEIKYSGDAALLVIDVQKEFCDPRGSRGNQRTKAIAERIKSIAPEFRKAGIPVYAVYFSHDGEKKRSAIDFYKFTPHKNDILIAKNADSAFVGSKINEILQRDGRKLLLTCGFNTNACVFETVMDARKRSFDVCLLTDLTENDNCCYDSKEKYIEKMRKKGVETETSTTLLAKIAAKKRRPAVG